MNFFNNKTILITGGTGSFGSAATEFLMKKTKAKKIIIFSRDENKQFEMQKRLKDKRLRFFIGDVRDKERLALAFKSVDFVIHAAALKQVPTAEYNPFECIKTNIDGSQNVISAAIESGVQKALIISTDKACNPVNLYGATKLCAEKLFINANQLRFHKPEFSVVRYGNVIASRGSVIPYFKELIKNKKTLTLTHPDMTRFFISLNQAVIFVLNSFAKMKGGEVYIPKMNSIFIKDLIYTLDAKSKFKITGVRPGEKINEVLFSKDESSSVYENKDAFLMYPSFFKNSLKKGKKTKISEYSSGDKTFLSIAKIKNIIKTINLK
jgi:UDP-N-acetylglucosamine 4,6-dehydratase